MRVVFVSSEVAPYSKTGGLADVAGALPQALAKLGVDVLRISPWYDQTAKYFSQRPHSISEHSVEWNAVEGVALKQTSDTGVLDLFVEHESFSGRPGLYVDETGKDYADNFERFALFCATVLAYCHSLFPQPDIIHCNDWQTALLPALLESGPWGEGLNARTVLTIHNLGYQGLFPAEKLWQTGLDRSVFNIDGFEYYGQANLLKGGIAYCDAFTTVSPTYALEIQTPDQGMGLDGFIRSQKNRLHGILNGIDVEDYDPAALKGHSLPVVPPGYEDFSANLPKGKGACKATLQRELGLPTEPEALLLGMITRFDPQKGVGLLLEALPLLADVNWQLIVLGSGAAETEIAVSSLPAHFPRQVAVSIGFDSLLARHIYAGCDALLMPSLYEPCGLNQMYAQRFGTLPIVRATGGLRDTVTDTTPETFADGTCSGFSFEPFTPEALADAIRRAWTWFQRREDWGALSQRVMRIDHSWTASAKQYIALYESLLRGEAPTQGGPDA